MASITMTASIIGCPAVTNRSAVATPRRLVVKAVRSVEGEKMVRYENEKEGSKNGRRNLMFAAAAAAAAAVCSVGGVAMADDEPKRGTPEAKKKYAPVCVTMPTARICRN
ncbi:photosystem II 5 kDa protein, chloroplastic [Trifolium repens]|nr:photosystem II 5 kDa protein, chloroplastic [Trifolium repens]